MIKSVPEHIAIIMDGNGRWAQQRNLARTRGHKEGANSVQAVVQECARLGVKLLTLYAFSVDNWKRPKSEVDHLMRQLHRFLVRQHSKLMKDNVVFEAIGRLEELPDPVYRQLIKTIDATRDNTGLRVCIALNYGSRTEIIDAVRNIAQEAAAGRLQPQEITEEVFRRHLYCDSQGKPFPDPDLIIRTAGEMRLSNFLLWQASYSELYITQTCWPDFREEQIRTAIESYGNRSRKFGGLKENDDAQKSADRAWVDNTAAWDSAP